MRLGATPVLIPNTMVKTQAAEDTTLETAWENRWVPGLLKLRFNSPLRGIAEKLKEKLFANETGKPVSIKKNITLYQRSFTRNPENEYRKFSGA